MNIKNFNCRKCVSVVLSVVMFATAFVSGFVFWDKPAQAATSVSTFAELKTACTNGGTINITKPIYITGQIKITKSVTLVCAINGHTYDSVDLGRHRNYHGNLFRVMDGGSLTVKCCISGRSNENQVDSTSDDNGLIVYKKNSSGSYSRVTDVDTIKTIVKEAINKGYSPVNKTNYGSSLVKVNDGGKLILNSEKSVLKYNYSPYSDVHSKAPVSTKYCTYENGSPEITDNYYLTLDDGSEVLFKYYTLPAAKGDADEIFEYTGVGGGAINSSGTVEISNGRIYGCSSRTGGGISFGDKDLEDTALTITGGRIYNNTSFAAGGGIRFGQGKALIKNVEVYQNRAASGGGGIWISNSAIFTIKPDAAQTVLIYDNLAGNYGGGIGINPDEAISGSELNVTGVRTNGVSNVQITNNIANCRGGGIGSVANTFIESPDEITLTNVDVSGNKATGKYLTTNSIDNILNGIGGGIQVSATAKATLTSCRVFGNEAQGGYRDIDKTTLMGGRGGGVYINPGDNTSKIKSCEIFENKVTEKTSASTAYGGGIFSSSDLDITSTEIYNNTSAGTGGGLCITDESTVNLNNADTKIYNNKSENNGGGVFLNDAATLTINNILCYGNENYGIFATGENTKVNINNGKYGFSSYTSASDYVVSRNTKAQIGIASGATGTVGTGAVRITSEITSGETVTQNSGVKNAGTFKIPEGANFEVYGTGTSFYNNGGTLDVDGRFYAISSAKDGLETVQNRRGLHNKNGTVDINSKDVYIQYGSGTGIYNESGKVTVDMNNGGGLHHNSGSNGGAIYNNGIFTLKNIDLHSNSATNGGGIYNTANGTVSLVKTPIYECSAANGGAIYNAGKITLEN